MQIKHSDMSFLVNNQVYKFPYLLKVDHSNIRNVWNILEKYIEVNLKKGVHCETKQETYDLLSKGHLQLWLNKDSFVMTSIQTTNVGRSLVIGFGYGNKHNIKDMVDGKIKEWAKEMGCKNLIVNGRLGWKRFFNNINFKAKSITLVKEI